MSDILDSANPIFWNESMKLLSERLELENRFSDIYVSEYFEPFYWSYGLQDQIKSGEILYFRQTELEGCPWLSSEQIDGKYAGYSKEVQSKLNKGTGLHYMQEKFNADGYIVEKEKRYWIKHKELPVVISGKLDAIFCDFNGIYIMDHKSLEFGALWHRIRNGPLISNLTQLSGYAFLFYINNCIEITRGVIKHIAKPNKYGKEAFSRSLHCRTMFPQECDIIKLEKMEAFFHYHPLIMLRLKKTTPEDLMFQKFLTDFNADNKYVCKDCLIKECQYNGK